jgi:hypothetical protein
MLEQRVAEMQKKFEEKLETGERMFEHNLTQEDILSK